MKVFVALALFEGCPPRWLNDPVALREALEAAIAAGPFTRRELVVVPFAPHGVTACAVVSESHLSLHSWPEEGRLFVDIASCSGRDGVSRALEAIRRAMPECRSMTVDERVVMSRDAAGEP